MEIRCKLSSTIYNSGTNETSGENFNVHQGIFQIMIGEQFGQWILSHPYIELGNMFIGECFHQSQGNFCAIH